MDCCGLLLGKPYQHDRNAIYHAKQNTYTLELDGKTYLIQSTSPSSNLMLSCRQVRQPLIQALILAPTSIGPTHEEKEPPKEHAEVLASLLLHEQSLEQVVKEPTILTHEKDATHSIGIILGTPTALKPLVPQNLPLDLPTSNIAHLGASKGYFHHRVSA